MDELISVIIPVYNVEPYLKKCVDSVLQQTYKNLEIILVDDGSTDGSGAMCDAYKVRDERVVVIHENNSGLAAARNTGVELAKGSWIAFLDSDDYIELDMYEILLKLALDHSADISSCETEMTMYGEQEKKLDGNTDQVLVFNPDEMIKGLLTQDAVRFEVWNKLWRRELIGDVRFKTGQLFEDVYFDRVLFSSANKMVHIKRKLHHYLIKRPGSTATNFMPQKLYVFHEFDEWLASLAKQDQRQLEMVVRCIALKMAFYLAVEVDFRNQPEDIKQSTKNHLKKYLDKESISLLRGKERIKIAAFLACPGVYMALYRYKWKDL